MDTQWKAAHVFTHTQCIFLPEGGLGADLCQVCESFLADIDPLGLSADLDDLQTAQSLATRAETHTSRMQIL